MNGVKRFAADTSRRKRSLLQRSRSSSRHGVSRVPADTSRRERSFLQITNYGGDNQATVVCEILPGNHEGTKKGLPFKPGAQSGKFPACRHLPVRIHGLVAVLFEQSLFGYCMAQGRYTLVRRSTWLMGMGGCGSVQYKKIRLGAFNQRLDVRRMLAQDRFDLMGGAIPPPYPYNLGWGSM